MEVGTVDVGTVEGCTDAGGAGGMAAVVVPAEAVVPAVGPGTGGGGAVQADVAAVSPAAIPASCSMRRRGKDGRGKDDWSISRS
ncbi:hypothetical protein [Arthrobacter sp. NPDC056493]|uniref:hypothetical protein n=1 Tax=Arthrobacter sp. NPDC056493 TaxID=3345839 RepID=UPI00366D128B